MCSPSPFSTLTRAPVTQQQQTEVYVVCTSVLLSGPLSSATSVDFQEVQLPGIAVAEWTYIPSPAVAPIFLLCYWWGVPPPIQTPIQETLEPPYPLSLSSPTSYQMAVMCRFSITNTGLTGRGWWSYVFRCGSEHSASIYSVPAEDHGLLKPVGEWKVHSQQRSRKVAKLFGSLIHFLQEMH